MFNISQLTNNDEYYTPKIAWQNIVHFLPRDKVIWECFYSPHSRSAEYLRELGFNCVYEPVDFFDKTPADLNADYYVSNMPFSMKSFSPIYGISSLSHFHNNGDNWTSHQFMMVD